MENYKCKKIVKSIWLFVLVSSLDKHSFVEGNRKIPKELRGLNPPKGTVKTIVDPDESLVIDCVDFYKQPTFDDPNFHKLQVDPSIVPAETKTTDEDLQKSGLYQNWRKYGECPSGTIPIRRSPKLDNHRKLLPFYDETDDPKNHEYAIAVLPYGKYYGARADFNVWAPKTEPEEFSVTQIWLISERAGGKLNTLEAGWMVYPGKFKNSKPTTFILWTKDHYESTGCYNFDCHGFIQTYAQYAIGVPLNSSMYDNPDAMEYLSVELYHKQNGPYGNWFLKFNGEQIGYWPGGTFDSLTDGADTANWGGEIVNLSPGGRHTTTQMGSGHFPYDGNYKASHAKKLAVMKADKKWVDVNESDIGVEVSRPGCYDIRLHPTLPPVGTQFYYGGPGYSSDTCFT